jgi:uncharacterized membrane protein
MYKARQRVLIVARAESARLYLARLDGFAAYAEWAREEQQPEYIGYVIVVEIDLDRKTAFWVKLMKMGAATGCHQMHERSFSIFGFQFPVCARCTGLGIGQLSGLIISFAFLKSNIAFLLVPAILSILILGVDGIGQYYQKWESTNLRRLVTGLLCGFFVTVFLVRSLKITLPLIQKLFPGSA